MADRTCSIDDCERPQLARQLCAAHYQRWRRHGSPLLGGKTPNKGGPALCVVPGCERQRGSAPGKMCATHFRRYQKWGAPEPPEPQTCAFEGCERQARFRTVTLCASHVAQRARGNELTPIGSANRPSGAILERDSASRKLCRRCDAWKSEAAFSVCKRLPDGLNLYCKACCREAFITNRYGLSGPQWRALRKAQEYRCKICGIHEDDLARPLYVDHDHSHCPGPKACPLCVRGLLCMRCNTGIGHLNHSPETLRAAIDYLREFGAGWLLSVPEDPNVAVKARGQRKAAA
jgi:hypothetical protein